MREMDKANMMRRIRVGIVGRMGEGFGSVKYREGSVHDEEMYVITVLRPARLRW